MKSRSSALVLDKPSKPFFFGNGASYEKILFYILHSVTTFLLVPPVTQHPVYYTLSLACISDVGLFNPFAKFESFRGEGGGR